MPFPSKTLKNSDFESILDPPPRGKDTCLSSLKKFQSSQILPDILNYGRNRKMSFLLKTSRDK